MNSDVSKKNIEREEEKQYERCADSSFLVHEKRETMRNLEGEQES